MMCPACELENVAGVELCESCGMDLTDSGVPKPTSGMQARILGDPLSSLGPWEMVSVSSSATVQEALAVMRDKRHGSVLILDGDDLKGIFTERDLLVKVLDQNVDPATTKITQVMTPNPSTLRASDPVAFAIHMMAVRGVRHVPVIKRGIPQGVVSIRGVLGYLTKQAR